jgi:hypothetical protein
METVGDFDYHRVDLRHFIDGERDYKGALIPEYTRRWEPNYDEYGGAWIVTPLGIDSSIAAQAGFEFEEVASVVEARRKSLYEKGKLRLRWRKKPGRKCIGDHVMSTAERVRRHRAAKKEKG